jgi:prepilin-type N-terminal cleavage/methylation domain-containing protein
MSRNRGGFTLIELLAVMAIIGVLAAIALPRYIGTKDKAKVAALRSDLRNAETAEETYYSDNGVYGTFAQLQTVGLLSLSPGDALTLTVATSGYTMHATDSSIASGINSCSVGAGTGPATDVDGVINCP